MSGVKLDRPQSAKALNELARLQSITKLEQDILMDMHICEIEEWDKMEYITMIKDLINGFWKERRQ